MKNDPKNVIFGSLDVLEGGSKRGSKSRVPAGTFSKIGVFGYPGRRGLGGSKSDIFDQNHENHEI